VSLGPEMERCSSIYIAQPLSTRLGPDEREVAANFGGVHVKYSTSIESNSTACLRQMTGSGLVAAVHVDDGQPLFLTLLGNEEQ